MPWSPDGSLPPTGGPYRCRRRRPRGQRPGSYAAPPVEDASALGHGPGPAPGWAPFPSHPGLDGTVTLVEGATFCVCDPSGDLVAERPEGLFMRDTRFLSRCELRVNGGRPERLAVSCQDPFSAIFVSRARSGASEPGHAGEDGLSGTTGPPSLMVFRSRYVGRGMREDIRVRNFGAEPAYCLVELFLDGDFADAAQVKAGRVGVADSDRSAEVVDGSLVLRYRRGASTRETRVSFSHPMTVSGLLASSEVIVPAGGEWSVCLQVSMAVDGTAIEPRYLCGQPVERATPAARLARWRREVPLVETDHEGLRAMVGRSAEDLGALRLFDPEHPERAVVAAGAPWSMQLYGRDSLLTSWMALLVDPDLALGVLQTLARFQGQREDPRTEEEPGRILHRVRFGDAPTGLGHDAAPYYGSADATPLFVMVLGELRRWGLAREVVDRLLPHADRALAWIEEYGDRDGDGYVEYQRASDRGLANQGWKDSPDGIRYADGHLARAPIALCEVQAYVYSAYLARAHFAREVGDTVTAERYGRKAASLREAFNRDFWLADRGWYAVGLDPDKAPIDSLTSNIGHCLWTGIVDEDKAPAVAARLSSPALSSGWGLRTLAKTMGGYNPLSYHCGSVWPHDSAIAAAGLMRYGFVAEAQRIVTALMDAARCQGGRLPELYAGLDRSELPMVVSYPASCSPQATAAASPLLVLRTLLRLDPWVPWGQVLLCPALPEGMGYLRVDRIPLGGSRVTVEVSHDEVKVEGLPPGLELRLEARQPTTAV